MVPGLVFVIFVSSLLNVDCKRGKFVEWVPNRGYHLGRLDKAGIVEVCPSRCNMSQLENQIAALFSEVNQIAPSMNALVSKVVASCNSSEVDTESCRCANVYDDSTGTTWSSEDDAAWIQFFLADETMLSSCDVRQHVEGGRMKDLLFEFSDNSNYAVTLQGRSSGLLKDEISFDPVVTSWVKITFLTQYTPGAIGRDVQSGTVIRKSVKRITRIKT